MTDNVERALDSDAPLTAAVHQRDVAHEAAEARSWDEAALVGRTITVNRPREELYAFWRDFRNLARFMENVERVDVSDNRRSHWVVKAPAGRTVEWDATITEEAEGEFIAWASEEGADVPNSGRVDFRDAGDRGTVVSVDILYDPPAGFIGRAVAKMFQREPAIQTRRELRRFKQLMETGEIATGARNARELEERRG